ncbi:MAG: hypothetical protein JOZ27_07355 [Caulobacteraceae bacterium]|nr:hypothetical protein [Caulobacteraceae bacterium]
MTFGREYLVRRTAALGLAIILANLAASGCVSTPRRMAVVPGSNPPGPGAGLSALATPVRDYPSIGGDVLKNASPDVPAAIRAAVSGSTH